MRDRASNEKKNTLAELSNNSRVDASRPQGSFPAPRATVIDVVQGVSNTVGRHVERLPNKASLLTFFLFVIVPAFLAIVYFGFIASDQYVSEIKLTTRSGNAQANDASGIFAGGGMASASQIGLDSNIIVHFLQSRDIVDAVDKKLNLRRLYSRPSVDPLSRISSNISIEALVDYWKGKVNPFFDLTTGIVSIQVRAFTAEDAYRIGAEIVAQSENFVNLLSRRARDDYLSLTRDRLEEANHRLKRARGAILHSKHEADSKIDLINKLKTDLETTLTGLNSVRYSLDEDSPTVRNLNNRVETLRRQIAAAEAAAGSRARAEGKDGVAKPGEGFEALETERDVAEQYYQNALGNYQKAEVEALRQATYLAVVVKPNKPESPQYPRRAVSVLITVLIGFGVWLFLLLAVRSINAHV